MRLPPMEWRSTPLGSITMFDRLLALPDRCLDRVSMYRLVIYYLVSVLGVAVALSVRGTLDYPPIDLVGSAAVAVVTCLAVNALFASTFESPANNDSAVISGLILTLIVGPAHAMDEYVFLGWAATLAMASKYIIARHHVHLFNPAALAVVATGTFAGQSASWWVATSAMTPFIIVGGMLVVRKLRRGDLVLIFLWTALFLTLAWSALEGVPWQQALRQGVLESPAWFLAFVMLTEPVTMPPTRRLQMLYGVLTGMLVVPQLHLATFYFTPELALIVANACTIPFRSLEKRRLYLDRAVEIGPGLVDFVYRPSPPLAYRPGQFMEWTLDHRHVDSRGKRRYFTLASSPTESSLRVGVKFEDEGSSFKQELAAHTAGQVPIIAALVAGDFTLPRNAERKLAFIASGIGITPFRSMVKYLTDRGEDRNVVMLYANRRYEEIVYRNVFQAAEETFRFRPVYVLSDASSAPPLWNGEVGRIDAAMIGRQIPDYLDRLFYVSGSHTFVQSVREALSDLGVEQEQVTTDYFSGLAA
jgi:ferredoxin-NADP reductase/Na+-translocating ferredoxin:NAD+ oxidoreductase RnfD subunit